MRAHSGSNRLPLERKVDSLLECHRAAYGQLLNAIRILAYQAIDD